MGVPTKEARRRMIAMDTTWQTSQQMVYEFCEVMDRPIPEGPSLPSAELRGLCSTLMNEEMDEYCRAEENDDLVNIAEELADIVYIAYHNAHLYGIPLDKVIAEKHRSNMSKLDDDGNPIKRKDGKVLKGPNFKPADVKKVLYGG